MLLLYAYFRNSKSIKSICHSKTKYLVFSQFYRKTDHKINCFKYSKPRLDPMRSQK